MIDDYDTDACNLLINTKLNFTMALNPEIEKEEEFLDEFTKNLVELKITKITKKEEYISCIGVLINLVKKFAELYLENKDEGKRNKGKFIEKLNALLGLPKPHVSKGKAFIIYLSSINLEEFTILTIFFILHLPETRESLPYLSAFFNFLSINEEVFAYVNNLPAPNSLKYSYIDYFIKLFFLIEKNEEEYYKEVDEMGMKNELKELSTLISDLCKKNNKDLDLIKKNDDIIYFDYGLYFDAFSYTPVEKIKNLNSEKIKICEMFVKYSTSGEQKETTLPFLTKKNYFSSMFNNNNNKEPDNSAKKNELWDKTVIAIFIYFCEKCDVILNMKPYCYSPIEIRGEKGSHHFFFCMDYDKNKEIDYSQMSIEIKDCQPLALPPGGHSQYGNDNAANDCSVNCPVCGYSNILNESNVEFKCSFCESPLF